MRAFLTSVLAVTMVLVAAPAAAQSTCDAPQVLLVLDRSSSMGERAPLPDGTLKWDAAVTGITNLTATYEDSVYFGLMRFPGDPGECTPGEIDVPVGPLHAEAIAGALGDVPPYGGYYTPMSRSLYVASEYSALHDASRRNYIALIADGWEWCDPYDATTRFEPVEAIDDMTTRGITAFIIGFGASVDALTLNRMARAAGTDLPGCDPTSDDPSRSDNCYTQVDDRTGLAAALDEIARSVTEEVCDGLDNDCDGTVDESLSRACENDCGEGTETCDDGVWVGCDAPSPVDEACDGVDNDCDGDVDEGCSCTEGDTMPCGEDEGECEAGEQSCTGGTWGPCEGAEGPTREECDGVDNDCDGQTDEEFDCGAGYDCVDGECVPMDEFPPGDGGPGPDPEDGGPDTGPGDGDGATTGCACRSAGSAGAAAPLGIAALLFALALRRRN